MMRRMLLASALVGAFTVTPHASADPICAEAHFSRPTPVNLAERCIGYPLGTTCDRTDFTGDLLMGWVELCVPSVLVPHRG